MATKAAAFVKCKPASSSSSSSSSERRPPRYNMASSPIWEQFRATVLDKIESAVQLPDDRLAVLALISAGRRGILLDYSTLYGRLPPLPVIEAVKLSQEQFINSTDEAASLFGSSVASMADFMSVALKNDNGFDSLFATKLGYVFSRASTTEEPEASLTLGYADTMEGLPSVRLGLAALTAFHNRHIKGRLSLATGEKWTWGKTAHVALIVMTSLQWQYRLANQFGSCITRSTLASISREQVQLMPLTLADTPEGSAIRLLVMRALGARSSIIKVEYSAPPVL